MECIVAHGILVVVERKRNQVFWAKNRALDVQEVLMTALPSTFADSMDGECLSKMASIPYIAQ